MPFTSALNAAMTLCEPGVSLPEIFGFTSVRRAAGAVDAGCCTSVVVVWRAGVLVGAGVPVVRGRIVGEEFVFWASAAEVARVKTKPLTIMRRSFISAPVNKNLIRRLSVTANSQITHHPARSLRRTMVPHCGVFQQNAFAREVRKLQTLKVRPPDRSTWFANH